MMNHDACHRSESPEFARLSLASAMALGIREGRFYRGAQNPCINLLLNYNEGCKANCAYCGLARKRPGVFEQKSFIKVDWPLVSLDEVIDRINDRNGAVKRVCLSMITNSRCVRDTEVMVRRLAPAVDAPISVLASPTIMKREHLLRLQAGGVDMLGVAVDGVTPSIFDRFRGKGVEGPHRWEHYWETVADAVSIFGPGQVGVHLIVGLGETEYEVCQAMTRVAEAGAVSQLFSFWAEAESALAGVGRPSWGAYLRVQLARYLIDERIAKEADFSFDAQGRLAGFDLSGEQLDGIISLGRPFMTSGCPGRDGEVACNRPFGNCLPDVKQWNYPYLPNEEELALIKENLWR
ncbi:MAG: radical SAM protein [Deltaproteobacteria bacterium]|nr:radical SAM protein [Deltaproteobacteria bacterium]